MPVSLTLRVLGAEAKGSPLTHQEVDTNFINLKNGISQLETNLQLANDEIDSNMGSISQRVGLIDNPTTGTVAGLRSDLTSLQTLTATHENRLDDIDTSLQVLSVIADHTTQLSDHENRLDTLEASTVGDVANLISTVSDHENRVDSLESDSLRFKFYCAGGSSELTPFDFTAQSPSTIQYGSVWYVTSSGWFLGTNPQPIYADEGDLIIIGDGGLHLTQPWLTVVRSSKDTLQGVFGFTSVVYSAENKYYSIDLDTTFKTRVSTIENRLQSLGSIFNYSGTFTPGIDESTAFDLSTLSSSTAGSYYKALTSGWVQLGTDPAFYINAGDGIVFTQTSVDVIDNSNTSITGTQDYVAVTGSTDLGFSVDLDTAFKTRVTNLETSSSGYDSRINLLEALPAVISGHTTQISDLETDVADHETRITTLESTATTLQYAFKTSGRAALTTTDPDQIIDSFESSLLGTAKYVIQATLADGSMHASEILVACSSSSVYITEYAKLNGGVDLVTYSANFFGTQVQIKATPVNVDTTITFARTAVKKV